MLKQLRDAWFKMLGGEADPALLTTAANWPASQLTTA
jgi:hypothetical protein